jgi:hypothetical protein
VPMEDMDLVVAPPLRRVIVNPLHPNFAEGPAKGYQNKLRCLTSAQYQDEAILFNKH